MNEQHRYESFLYDLIKMQGSPKLYLSTFVRTMFFGSASSTRRLDPSHNLTLICRDAVRNGEKKNYIVKLISRQDIITRRPKNAEKTREP